MHGRCDQVNKKLSAEMRRTCRRHRWGGRRVQWLGICGASCTGPSPPPAHPAPVTTTNRPRCQYQVVSSPVVVSTPITDGPGPTGPRNGGAVHAASVERAAPWMAQCAACKKRQQTCPPCVGGSGRPPAHPCAATARPAAQHRRWWRCPAPRESSSACRRSRQSAAAATPAALSGTTAAWVRR